MPREKASRKYQLTINNPSEHGFTHDVIRSNIGTLSGCLYWCLCDEVGQEGTPHTHVYLVFKNAVMFSTLHKRFYGAHIEPAKGSNQENRDYIRKEGKWADDAKHETSLPETFEESGELPEEPQRRQKDSEAILSMISEGATDAEILREYPTAINRLQHIGAARQTLLAEQHRRTFRELHVVYLWGKTGVGKTRTVMEKYGYENVFRVTNYQHPFDNYGGETVILFDEFRSSLPISDMLKYLDGYPVMLPCRYADKVACFTTVYLVSNIPLEKQYPNVQYEEPETWQAFRRRFHEVYEMGLDDGPDMPF